MVPFAVFCQAEGHYDRYTAWLQDGTNMRLSQGHSDMLSHRESNKGFATFQLL